MSAESMKGSGDASARRIDRWFVLGALLCACLGPGCSQLEPGVPVGTSWEALGVASAQAEPERPGALSNGAGMQLPGALAPEVAAAAWRRSPVEGAAVDLARAYFPAATRAASGPASASLSPATALRVTLPDAAGGEMELETRGYVFRVSQLESGDEPVSARVGGGTFYGPRHFWIAAGELTRRVEEYVVMEGGGGAYQAEYRVTVPDGITALRDAGEYLELLEASSTPVLRLHYAVARDAQGRGRQGQVTVWGAAPAGDLAGLPVLALRGRVFRVKMEVPLDGLEGPVVVDPGWSFTGSMAVERNAYTLTPLPTGKVLAAGGNDGSFPYPTSLSSAEVYDPWSGAWSAAPRMATNRHDHTATVLRSGLVLVAGGYRSSSGSPGGSTVAAELYDPVSGSWVGTGAMLTPRWAHSATLLLTGQVLVSGGVWTSTELYDPATGTWSATGEMSTMRFEHTATLLPSGKVLAAGGLFCEGACTTATILASTEVYEPATGAWTPSGSMAYARRLHSAMALPSGKVLAVGGYGDGDTCLFGAELYDPATGLWSLTGGPTSTPARTGAALLPSGKVLLVGRTDCTVWNGTSTLYDPATGTWSSTVGYVGEDNWPRSVAVVLRNGHVFSGSQLYDPGSGAWSPAAAMAGARSEHTATLLPSGKVLVAGGYFTSPSPVATAELYDAATGTWSPTGPLATARSGHTATLLRDGKVLVVGGRSGSSPLASAELYDPSTGDWSATASLSTPRVLHTATLLLSGKVLVAGGTGTGALAGAELYDPVLQTWSPASPLLTGRQGHTATLLPNGKVLVAGGSSSAGVLGSCELYDPVLGTWSATGALGAARSGHTATELDSGRVLVAGGLGASAPLASTELYSWATGTWLTLVPLSGPRVNHAAALLRTGAVLVTGTGETGSNAEAYDLVTYRWTPVAQMATARMHHTVTPLPSGRVLVAGGHDLAGSVTSAETYEDTGAQEDWRPALDDPGPLEAGATVTLNGTRLTGISEGSDGTTTGASPGFPLLTLRRMDGDVFSSLRAWNASRTAVQTRLPATASGYYVLSVSTGGIQGGRIVRIVDTTPPPAPLILSPADGSVVVEPMLPILGSAEPGSTVTVTMDGAPAGAVAVNAAGNWTFTPTAPLANGSHTATARAADAAGNVSPASTVTFFIDPTPPAAPLVLVPSSGAFLRVTAPTVSGVAEGESTVTVSFDGSQAGVATADGAGSWTFTAVTALAQGSHSVTARATDGSGNVSPPSAAVPFTIDTVAPSAPVVLQPASMATVSSAPRISGTAEPGSTVAVSLDGVPAGSVAADGAGAWSFTAAALSEGAHAVAAQAVDAAGNQGPPSAATAFLVDATAPAAPVIQAPAGPYVRTAIPTFSGTAEAGSAVTLLFDGTAAGTVGADAAGGWAFTPASELVQGPHSVTARASDAAGNVSPDSAAHALVVDSVAPGAPTIMTPANMAQVRSVSPSITGSAEAGATVGVSIDGVLVRTLVVDGAGVWSLVPAPVLSEGAHSLVAQATDPAGNVGPVAAAVSFTIDTVAPAAPVVQSPASQTTFLTRFPTIAGTAEARSTVTISLNGSVAGIAAASDTGTWSFTPAAALGDGQYAVVVQARDAAGNNSPLSGEVLFQISVPAPVTPAILSPTAGQVMPTATPTIYGTAQTGKTVLLTLDAAAVESVAVDAAGNWQYAPASPLVPGVHVVSARSTDGILISPASEDRSFTVASAVPPPEILKPLESAAVHTATPGISGNAVPDSQVSIRLDGSLVATVSVSHSGQWSYVPATPLQAGAHQILAFARDDGGRTSSMSETRTFIVVDGPPQVPVLLAPVGGATVRHPDLVFTGTGEFGTTVSVELDGALLGQAEVSSTGTWSLTPATWVETGPHEARVLAADSTGIASTPSAAVRFAVTLKSYYGCSAAPPAGGLVPLALLLLWPRRHRASRARGGRTGEGRHRGR